MIQSFIDDTRANVEYYLLVTGAAVIALVGILIDSIIVGIGIAVSLMPPLTAIGIGLAVGWGDLMLRAAIIFGLNVFGIFAGSAGMFWILKKNIFNLKKDLQEIREG